jgi:hypothetical protein
MVYRRIGRMLCLTATAAVLLSAFGAATASATPTGEYSVFADCPLEHRPLKGCIVSKTFSGEFTLGKQTVPIVSTQTLQGGYFEEEGAEGVFTLVEAIHGETFSKTAQSVPGGLLGLVKCNEIKGAGLLEDAARVACELVFENGVTGVNATAELAGPASVVKIDEENILSETGVGMKLPIKIKLENPLLGSKCYIGSNSEPVVLELTSGATSPSEPNRSIKGKLGELGERGEGGILVINNNTLVDNDFKAPGVTGCGGLFASLLDPIIDEKIGLPAAAGHNTAVLNNNIEQAGRLVIEEFGE